MKISPKDCLLLAGLLLGLVTSAAAQGRDPKNPTWWDKYLYLSNNGSDPTPGTTASTVWSTNVDVSNECGPQSETYITLNPASPKVLAGGSNEIFRDPMRGYYSTDGGASWGGVDLPLPAPLGGPNNSRFGSDPTLAFDSRGNLYYGYIVVIASAVQLVEMVMKKFSPALFRALGIYLPLITTNCAVLGVALFQTSRDYDFAQSIAFSSGAGVGFSLALVLMAGLRERLELSEVPVLSSGTVMTLMLAGILSLAFMGFAGLGGH